LNHLPGEPGEVVRRVAGDLQGRRRRQLEQPGQLAEHARAVVAPLAGAVAALAEAAGEREGAVGVEGRDREGEKAAGAEGEWQRLHRGAGAEVDPLPGDRLEVGAGAA